MTKPDAALTIARWCWPETCAENEASGWLIVSDGTYWLSVFDPKCFDAHALTLHGVRAAELVVIERGLAAEYGHALCLQDGIDRPEIDDPDFYSDVAHIATAPLDARVRALLAVIEAQK